MSSKETFTSATDRVSSFFARRFGPRLRRYPNLQKIITNLGWLSADYALRLVGGLLVGAWVARYLGPFQFGQFSYALAIVALFSAAGGLGLDGVVGRDLIRAPSQKGELLGTSFLLRLASTLILYLGLTLYAFFGVGDSTLRLLLVILGGTLFSPVAVVFSLWFNSYYLSKYVVWCQIAGFGVATLTRITLIWLGSPLVAFAWATLAELLVTGILVVAIYATRERDLLEWKFRYSVAKKLLRESWPLIFAGLAVTIYVKIDQVMLAQILNTREVGIYSAAVRVSEVWYVIPTIIASSLFPSIIRSRDLGQREYHHRLQRYYNFTALLAYALSIPMTLLAPWIIRILYGSDFKAATVILMVHIWASIFVFQGIARTSHLLNEGHLHFSFVATSTGAALNIALNLIFIPAFGAVGAAIATVISYAVSALFSGFFYAPTRAIARMQVRSLIFPLNCKF